MRLSIALWLSLLFALTVPAAHADDLASQQPSYTRIASQCGAGESQPSFSTADYVQAMKDAAKALKDAKKQGSRPRQDAIKQSVERLKECQTEEVTKFVIPPMKNCRQFIDAYKVFSARAATLIAAKKITEADRARIRESFRSAAESCVRDMMKRCIDPTKTSHVDFVIEAMTAASEFGFVATYAKESGIERFLTVTNPGFLRMTFCTETDYACKGDKAACKKRIDQIKPIMETYMRD
jgi:hypothetical protein